ncbi:hypothetical protein CPB97_010870 [Podila verticillata]|nr:hypothetical protein CPB97_010870 [Podila verticillata]
MSTSVPSVSIFDIALIVDSICHDLSLNNIQACRRVNKQWSILFKPHLWSTAKLLSPLVLPNDPKLAALFANKHWIRSLTLDVQQAGAMSDLGHFTALRELALLDGHTFGCGRRVSMRNHVVALINSNPHLESLRIGLCFNYYNDHESELYQEAIMLVIASHPSLTRLTWHVPKGYERCESAQFAKCLLYACHSGFIQELAVVPRYVTEPFHYDDMFCDCWWRSYQPFSHDDFARPDLECDPVYRRFKNKLEVPMDELEEPFAFRKLCLPPQVFDSYTMPLLRHCPDLQHIEVSMALEDEGRSAEILKVLAGSPNLRRLVLKNTCHDVDYSRAIGRFKSLQWLHVPYMTESNQVLRIVDVLASSSRESLESLGISMEAVTAEDVVYILATFPHLKELDVGSVRIYTRTTPGVYEPLQDKDLNSMEMVVRDWDLTRLYRQHQEQHRYEGDMDEWWSQWSRALRFMKAVRDEYHQYQQELRPSCRDQRISILMQFMYPVQAFMTRAQRLEYLQATGPEAKHARGFTLMDAYRLARGMVERKEEYEYWQGYWQDDFYPYYGRWNEYDARVGYDWCGMMDETAQEYTIAKSRNRHRSLRDRKRSTFRRPFKK